MINLPKCTQRANLSLNFAFYAAAQSSSSLFTLALYIALHICQYMRIMQ